MVHVAPPRRAAVGTLVALMLVVACGSEPAGPAAAIESLLTAPLSGTVGTAVPTLAARVTDASGNAVQGVAVTFSVTSGGGSLDPVAATAGATGALLLAPAVSDTTDNAGEVRARWTLGPTAGAQVVTAAVSGVSAISFPATATPDVPNATAIDDAAAFIGVVSGPADGPLIVQVSDRFGNAVPDATVSWSVLSGAGAVAASSSVSDASGLARTDVTLGPIAGLNLYRAQVGSLPPDTIGVVGVGGASDPAGDAVPTGTTFPAHDATFLGAASVEGFLFLYVRFTAPVGPTALSGPQPATALFANYDLDLDRDTTTGFYTLRQCIGGPPLNFGADAFVDLDQRSAFLGIVSNPPPGAIAAVRVDSLTGTDRCASEFTGAVLATVPVYRANAVTLVIPLSFLADDGGFDLSTFMVSAGANTVTDVVPDSLALTIPAPTASATTGAARALAAAWDGLHVRPARPATVGAPLRAARAPTRP